MAYPFSSVVVATQTALADQYNNLRLDAQTNPPGFYGDGADGAVTISVDTTLTRDMRYTTLVVNSGINLTTGGFRIFATVSVTINGVVRRNGVDASGSTQGAALSAGSLGGSGAGAATSGGFGGGGGSGAGVILIASPIVTVSATGSITANGGNGGNATSGGGGAGGVSGSAGGAATVSVTTFKAYPMCVNLYDFVTPALMKGGGGGGSGANTNNAGGSAGTGTPSAGGGAGGAGGDSGSVGCGGGGGGGGGSINIVCGVYSNSGSVTASGGTKGLKSSDGVDGVNGSAGTVTVHVRS